jgi:hypothetical protein
MPIANRVATQVPRLWCFALLSFCGLLTVAPPMAAASRNGDAMPSAEVSSLAQQQGISTELAERDLQLQQQAGNIVVDLQNKLGTNYAGVWFDPSAAQFHIDIAPQTDKASAEEVTDDDGITAATNFDTVSHTWAEIETTETTFELPARLLDP